MTKQNKLTIAFEVDDTLIIPVIALPNLDWSGIKLNSTDGIPNYETISIYGWFQAEGHTMVVWSKRGKEYAKRVADELGLQPDFIGDKLPDVRFGKVDICFDDSTVDLATVNVKVKRINNQISRKEKHGK